MGNASSLQVHRVPVTEEPTGSRLYDYADAFEVQLPEPDPDPPQTWVLAGLNEVPALVDRVALWLGIDSEPSTSPDRIDGWQVVENTADVIHLEQTVPLMHVVLVGRRVGTSGRRFTSMLYYQRPALARLVWAVVGIGHRRMARRLISSASTRSTRSGREDAGRAA